MRQQIQILIPPTPQLLGLEYASWRPAQVPAIQAALKANVAGKRHVGLNLPTGTGKTAVAIAIAKLLADQGKRLVILTSTRALQDQYHDTDSSLADIRGMRNYRCLVEPDPIKCDRGPCRIGEKCQLRTGGCIYFDTWQAAVEAPIVVTSYAYWLSGEDRLGTRDVVILDEAHAARGELLDAVGAEWLESSLPCAPPEASSWARSRLKDYKARSHRELIEQFKLQSIARVRPDWSIVVGQGGQVVAEPRDIRNLGETLFREAKLVVWMSATLTKSMIESMIPGKESGSIVWHEAKSPFPAADRPVIWVQTGRMDSKTEAESLPEWKLRIDQIIGRRLDRKGIVHTVSYRRRDLILAQSKYREHMITHENSHDIDEIVARWKAMEAPAILVSPSVGTGFDLGEADYQIIGKVPFPSKTDPKVKVRTLNDPDYVTAATVQALVQASGRAVRKLGDRAETFIIDDHVSWLVRKFRGKGLFPAWWLEAYREAVTLGKPIELGA